jgi:hypothetical protein
MSGPAIPYDELYDFPGFFKALEQAKTETKELGTIIEKIGDRTKVAFADTLQQISNKKIEIIPEKEITKLQNVDKELNALGASAANSKSILDGLSKVTTITSDSIVDLEKQAKTLTSTYKNLSEEERNNAEVGGVLIKNIAEIKNETSKFSKVVTDTTKTLTTSEDSYNALSRELTRMRAELKNMPGAFDQSTGALNKSNKAAVELSKRITETDSSVKKIDASMGQFTRNVGNYEEATVSLREQLRAMRMELTQMAIDGKEGSVAYEELVQKAGELDDAMGDVSASIKRVGSDTRNIEGMVGIFQGIAGAAAVAEGATQLFGDENEDLVNSIAKLQAVTSILMGLQSIQETLQKESAAMLTIINFQRSLEVIRTNLQTAAESKNIIVRYSAVLAQKLLNAVMAANPAGLLIMAMITLAGIVLLFAGHTKKASERMKDLNDAQQLWYDLDQLIIEDMRVRQYMEEKTANDQIKYAKARNASQLEMIDLEIKAAEIRNNNAIKIFTQVEADNKQINTQIEKVKLLADEYEELSTVSQKTKEEQKQSDEKKRQLDLEKKTLADMLTANKEYYDSDVDLKDKNEQKTKLLAQIELRSKKATIDSKLSYAKLESQNELNLKIQSLENAKAKELEDLKNSKLENELYLKEVQATNDKYRRQESDMRKEFNQKQKENALNSTIAYTQANLDLVRKGSDEEYALKEKLITETYELSKSQIEFSIHDEALKTAKLKELYDKQLQDKKELEKEKALAEMDRGNTKSIGGENLEVVKNNQTIASTHSSYAEINKARKANEDIAMGAITREWDLNEAKFAKLKELGLDDVNATADYENKKTELITNAENLRLKKIQDIADAEKQIKQAAVDFVLTGISSVNQMYDDAANARIDSLNAEKDGAIKAAGDNADAKARIEFDYNKKIGKEKAKIAKADKIAALFTAAINTYMGITKALASAPPPFNIILAAITAAAGAVQIAAIAAKPIPAYKHGIDDAPEGFAIVNDQPGSTYKEMIVSGNKAYIPQKRNQMVYLRRHDKVIKAAETKGITENIRSASDLQRLINHQALNDSLAIRLESGRRLEVINNMSEAMAGNRLSEKLIGDAVGKHIENIPQPIYSWDERGHRRGLRKGNSLINYLNQRNSL